MITAIAIWSAFIMLAAALAIAVALCSAEADRRQDAVQVLRAVLGMGATCGGAVTALIKLHESGLF